MYENFVFAFIAHYLWNSLCVWSLHRGTSVYKALGLIR